MFAPPSPPPLHTRDRERAQGWAVTSLAGLLYSVLFRHESFAPFIALAEQARLLACLRRAPSERPAGDGGEILGDVLDTRGSAPPLQPICPHLQPARQFTRAENTAPNYAPLRLESPSPLQSFTSTRPARPCCRQVKHSMSRKRSKRRYPRTPPAPTTSSIPSRFLLVGMGSICSVQNRDHRQAGLHLPPVHKPVRCEGRFDSPSIRCWGSHCMPGAMWDGQELCWVAFFFLMDAQRRGTRFAAA